MYIEALGPMQTVCRCGFFILSVVCIAIPDATTCCRAETPLPCAQRSGNERKLVVDTFGEGHFPFVHDERAADVFVDSKDWTVARIAGRDLTKDIERVTGCKALLKHSPDDLSSLAVLVGTLGKSPVIDGLVKAGKIEVEDIRGQWETSLMQVISDPLPGVKQGLVIVGSDRRGTAYGVYELSRLIGVSPWYWWADVTSPQRASLYVRQDRVRIGPPAVKYRGIFINDEMWGIRPWAAGNFAPDEGMGLGPKTHRKIFELLLRLRANYIWPAMHRGTKPFNYYAENKVVADDYAIVMGSSHIEPMLRNNMHGAEWDQEDGTEWNYLTNRDAIYDYWERRIKTNGRYENIYTIGMRGKDDEAMKAGRTAQEKIKLLERIFRDQREILTRRVNPNVSETPQVFIPYTEVLGLYDQGLQVPRDAIICWPDDNFGYIRRLPTRKEQARPGGSGVYYHIQWLNGATTAYTWLNTTPPALIWEEMNKAYHYDARNLWVLNVGDIKPGEIGMEFFLDMAWCPNRWNCDNVREFLVQWAERDLDARFAQEIAEIMEEYFRLGYTRRPEHLVQYSHRDPLRFSWFNIENYNDEAERRLDRYDKIARRADAVYQQLPVERKDAFFQLVLYPVRCASLMNQKIICADKSLRYAGAGRASAAEYARKARAAAKEIIELTDHYNKGLITVGDKWNYMVSWAPGPWGSQRHQFEMPPLSDFDGLGPPRLGVALEGGNAESLPDLSVFTKGRRYIDLFNQGKGRIDWSATASEPWVILSVGEGQFETQQRIWVQIDWDRVPKGGKLKASVDIAADAGNRRIIVPVFNPATPRPDTVTGFVESHGYVCMEAEHFSRRHNVDEVEWGVVGGLGRSGDSVTVFPPNVASQTKIETIRQHAPLLEYDMYVFTPGEATLEIQCLPTQSINAEHGLRLAISLNDSEPRILTPVAGGSVLENVRRISETVEIPKPGRHVLRLWMVDPGVVVDRITLYTKPPKDSYLGPPESYCRAAPTK